jgi:23S rRNA (adenine2503-C2)-methyltransferase
LPLIPEDLRRPYRARQILAWIYRRGVSDFQAMTDIPKPLRDFGHDALRLGTLALERRQESAASDATKFLWRLEDGRKIESVHLVLPTRETFCISSQVGCAYGCAFCATATMGFRRHLRAPEIFEQVYLMREDLRRRRGAVPTFNIVFMGMGEPLANYDAVVDAVARLTDPLGLDIGDRRITISTVGLVPGIRRLAREGRRVGLAVSLNATTDEQRQTIMPVARKYRIAEILDAAGEYARKSGRRVTFEYVLLRGVNDTLEDARRLSELARAVPSKINLIPFNPFPESAMARPETDRVQAFARELMKSGPAIMLRAPRGVDIAAACGQLAVRG